MADSGGGRHETLRLWEWGNCWGWDQPMVAMTATRLEQPQVAVDTLLMNSSTNLYLPTGYNHPSAQGTTSAYLPGNGGCVWCPLLACRHTVLFRML